MVCHQPHKEKLRKAETALLSSVVSRSAVACSSQGIGLDVAPILQEFTHLYRLCDRQVDAAGAHPAPPGCAIGRSGGAKRSSPTYFVQAL